MYEQIGTQQAATTEVPRRHSGVGIASFVMGLVNVVLFLGMMVFAIALGASSGGHVDEHAASTIMLGLFAILIALICLIGTGLGIAGVVQKIRRRVFGVIGLCLNGGVLLLIILIILVGLSHS